MPTFSFILFEFDVLLLFVVDGLVLLFVLGLLVGVLLVVVLLVVVLVLPTVSPQHLTPPLQARLRIYESIFLL